MWLRHACLHADQRVCSTSVQTVPRKSTALRSHDSRAETDMTDDNNQSKTNIEGAQRIA